MAGSYSLSFLLNGILSDTSLSLYFAYETYNLSINKYHSRYNIYET